MPQIGEIERGVWLASGFGGHGLNTSAMGGELVARGLVDDDQTWRLFAPYELVWAGGVLGSVLAQGIYWGTRPIERVEQGLARYRERAGERKAARLRRPQRQWRCGRGGGRGCRQAAPRHWAIDSWRVSASCKRSASRLRLRSP